MKNNWPTKKLGEVLELHYGKGISKHERKANGKYPFYGANGILDHSDKFLVDGEAIIVGRKGSAGELTRVSGKFWPSDVTYYVLGNKNIDIDYAFHLLKSLNLQKFAVGVKPGINRNRVYEIEISLPPLPEQKKIVARLEKLLAKVKEAKRLGAEALELTQNLLSAELHKIFAEGKKKGWEEKKFYEAVEIEAKKNRKNLPYVGMEDVESNTGKFLGSKEVKSVKSVTSCFNQKHVLYGKLRPYLNKVLLPDFEGHCSTEFLPLKPNGKYLIREWLSYWIMSKEIVEKINATTTGARMPRANMNEVKKFNILLPHLPEQKKIVARLDGLQEKIQKLEEHQKSTLADLDRLEQSILHEAFEGKLI